MTESVFKVLPEDFQVVAVLWRLTVALRGVLVEVLLGRMEDIEPRQVEGVEQGGVVSQPHGQKKVFTVPTSSGAVEFVAELVHLVAAQLGKILCKKSGETFGSAFTKSGETRYVDVVREFWRRVGQPDSPLLNAQICSGFQSGQENQRL